LGVQLGGEEMDIVILSMDKRLAFQAAL
jgi:hypothetical protein